MGVGFLFALAVFAIGFAMAVVPDSTWNKKERLCDKSVAALLHSKDLIEVVRGGFIVIHLECSIGRRLDD